MANLKDIRKRISTVKNTQQITSAMKMVAAAKLRRAQDAITASRPYAVRLEGILESVVSRMEEVEGQGAPHPLLEQRGELKKVEIIVLTSDRGLCGGFNSNIVRRALRFVYENEDNFDEIIISTIGKKGHDLLKRPKGYQMGTNHEGIFAGLDYQHAEAIAKDLAQRYLGRDLDAVYLLYNRFHSAINQEVTLMPLLPISPPTSDEEAASAIDFIYEPGRDDVLQKLVPQYLTTQVWRALLESVASEHGARMTSMDNATRNAGEMIDNLTLIANRTRQAAITTELMEITSGAEALK